MAGAVTMRPCSDGVANEGFRPVMLLLASNLRESVSAKSTWRAKSGLQTARVPLLLERFQSRELLSCSPAPGMCSAPAKEIHSGCQNGYVIASVVDSFFRKPQSKD